MCLKKQYLIRKTTVLRECGLTQYVFYCGDVKKQGNGSRECDAHPSQVVQVEQVVCPKSPCIAWELLLALPLPLPWPLPPLLPLPGLWGMCLLMWPLIVWDRHCIPYFPVVPIWCTYVRTHVRTYIRCTYVFRVWGGLKTLILLSKIYVFSKH